VSGLDGNLINTVGAIFILLLLGGIFLFLARKILRIALKLALAAAIIFVLVVGAGMGWWRGWFETGSKNHIPAATTNRRTTAANRSPR